MQMNPSIDNDFLNPYANVQQNPDGTVRKRLFPSPAPPSSTLRSLKYPRTTMSPISNRQFPFNNANNINLNDPSFLKTPQPQPSRVETLTSQHRRPSVVNIQGTPSVRSRLVSNNSNFWHSRQADDLTAWLNHELLHPLHDANSLPQYRLSQDSHFLNQIIQLHTLFRSADFQAVRANLKADLRANGFAMKDHINLLKTDSKDRRQLIWLILCNYHPAWLLPALCVLFNSNFIVDLDIAVHLSRQQSFSHYHHQQERENNENSYTHNNHHHSQNSQEEMLLMNFLQDVLNTTILSPRQHIFSPLSSDTAIPSSPQPPSVERTNFHHLVLQRVLELILLLDSAKVSPSVSLHADPPLFRVDSKVKSSAELLSRFDSTFIHDIVDLNKFFFLRKFRLHYKVPACEQRSTFVVSSLVDDLRDGIKLCKLAALLTNDRHLLYKVKVPLGGNMQRENQKIREMNVELAMLSIQKFASVTLKRQFAWDCSSSDFVAGRLAKILSVLWEIVALWRDTKLLRSVELKAELEVVKDTFRKNKQQQLQESSKFSRNSREYQLELSPSVVSPSNLAIYETFTNLNTSLLLEWCAVVCGIYGLSIKDFTESFRDGAGLCLILQHYYPEYVPINEIVRLNPTEVRTEDQKSLESEMAERNFDQFSSKARVLGHFPLVTISVETALGNGFISMDKRKTFGRTMDLLISYLFYQLFTQKGSLAIMKQMDDLLEKERQQAIKDQAARCIVRALQHVQTKERLEVIDASPRGKHAGSYVMSPAHRNSPARRYGGGGSPMLGRSNTLNRPLEDRLPKINLASKAKHPIRSPFSGPKSYEKYLNASSSSIIHVSSPRSKNIANVQSPLRSANVISRHNLPSTNLFSSFPLPDAAKARSSPSVTAARQKWAVDVITRHYMTYKKRHSVILVQACGRGYLARREFLAQLDNMQQSDVNINDSMAVIASPASTVPDDVGSPTEEEMARIRSPVSSSLGLTFSVLPKIQDHMKALEEYAKRMKAHEQKMKVDKPNNADINALLSGGETRVDQAVNMQGSLDSSDQPNLQDSPPTEMTESEGNPPREEESQSPDSSNSPHSSGSEGGPPPQPQPSGGDNPSIRSSGSQDPSTPSSSTQSQSTDAVTANIPSTTIASPVPINNGTRQNPLWRAMKWAGKNITKSLLSVSSEVGERVNNSLTDANEARTAVESVNALRHRMQDIGSKPELVASARKQAMRRRSTPARPTPLRRRDSAAIREYSQTMEDDLIADRANACAEAKYNELMKESKMVIENTRKRKHELAINLEALDDQCANDHFAHIEEMRNFKSTMGECESIMSSFEKYICTVEEIKNNCDVIQSNLSRRSSMASPGQSSAEVECMHEMEDANDILKSLDLERLEDRLHRAETTFHESMSRMQMERTVKEIDARKRKEINMRLQDLERGRERDEVVAQADLQVASDQLQSIDTVVNRFQGTWEKIAEIETWCNKTKQEEAYAENWELSSPSPLSSPRHTDEYEKTQSMCQELIDHTYAAYRQMAVDAYEDEMMARRLSKDNRWAKRRKLSLDAKDWEQNTASRVEQLDAEEEKMKKSLEKSDGQFVELESASEAVEIITQGIAEGLQEASDDDESEDELEFGVSEPTPEFLATVNTMACNVGLFKKIDRELGKGKVEEALNHAEDKYSTETLRCALRDTEKWLARKQNIMKLRNFDEEATDIIRIEAEDELEDKVMQEAIDRQRDEYAAILESPANSKATVADIDITSESVETDLSEVDATNTVEMEYIATLNEDKALQDEKEKALFAEAGERFADWYQAKMQLNMSNWIHRKELEVNLKELLDDEQNETENYNEFLNGIDSELAQLVPDNNQVPSVDSILATSKAEEEVMVESDREDEESDNANELFLNDCDMGPVSTLSEESKIQTIQERLEDGWDNFVNDQRATFIENTDVFTKRKVLELCMRESIHVSEQDEDEYARDLAVSAEEIEQCNLLVMEANTQLKTMGDDVETVTYDDDDDTQMQDDSSFETVEILIDELDEDQIVPDLAKEAEYNFNDFMRATLLRDATRLVSRREVAINIVELEDTQMEEDVQFKRDIEALDQDISSARNLRSNCEELFGKSLYIEESNIMERTEFTEDFTVIESTQDLCKSIEELSARIDEEHLEMEELYVRTTAEMEEMDELEDMIESRRAERVAADEELSAQDMDTITLTVSEAPLSPTLNDDTIPDIRATDNVSNLIAPPHPNIQAEDDLPSSLSNDVNAVARKSGSYKKVIDEVVYEEVASSRQSQRNSLRRPLQDVSTEHVIEVPEPSPTKSEGKPTTPRPHFARDEYKLLFSNNNEASEHDDDEEDFVSLSSFASRPSSSGHHLRQLNSQRQSPVNHLSPATALQQQRQQQLAQFSPGASEFNPVDRETPGSSLWPIGESDSLLLGRLSAELDALRVQMSPTGTDALLSSDSGSIGKLQGVMRRISMAAALPSPAVSQDRLLGSHEHHDESSSSDGYPQQVAASSSPMNEKTSDNARNSSYASILRNVLMVMRQCIRSEEHTPLVELGMKIIQDLCTVQDCLSELLDIEENINVISTCVQFYRDNQDIFTHGANVLYMMNQNETGMELFKMNDDVVGRLEKVRNLMKQQLDRTWRNKQRIEKSRLIRQELERRKNGEKTNVSLSEIMKQADEQAPRNGPIDEAVHKLSITIERSRINVN